MKTKSNPRGPNFGIIAATLLCSFTMVAVCVSGTAASFSGQARTLTFVERVGYQRAIEEVYWRHRIWPTAGPEPSRSLKTVMSQAQLEKKVTDYLRKSQALEDYWHRPITGEQLQAEMDRMAEHTKAARGIA